MYRPGTIVNDIWNLTQAAKLLLADLTGRNPNVFYELGLAHALAKPVVLVTESIEHVPFDLRALRVLEYDKNDPRWGELLREKITAAIQQVLGAPLEAVLPAFLKVEKRAKPESVSEQEKAILGLRRDLDLMRTELRTYGRPPFEHVAGPEEARQMLERYLRIGMPLDAIALRLERRGVPPDWIERELEEFKRRRAPLFEQPQPKPKAPAVRQPNEGMHPAAQKPGGG